MDEPVLHAFPKDAKGILESNTIRSAAVTLLTAALAHWNPTVGAFVRDNADTILGLFGVLSVGLRATTTKPLSMSLFSVSKTL